MVSRRQPAGIFAEQRDQRLLEVAGGDPLEVEDRDQHLEGLRPARVGRQNRRREADALRAFADTVAHNKSISVEAGIADMLIRMETGRFKVFTGSRSSKRSGAKSLMFI